MTNLAEQLRAEASAAQKTKAANEKRAATRAANIERREAEEMEVRATEWAAEHLEEAIDTLGSRATKWARQGETKTWKKWRIDRGSKDPEPTEKLLNYRALSRSIAEHFTDQGMVVNLIEERDGYEDTRVPSDEGWRPFVPTDHIIGVQIDWSQPAE